MESRDFRLLFLYEYKLGNNSKKAAENINKAFGQNTVKDRTIRFWFCKFKTGDTTLENQSRGHPDTALENDKLKALVESNPRVTVRELARHLGVGLATVWRHLKIIGKIKKMDKWVPHELKENHKLRRMEVSSSLLSRNKIDPFLHRIITTDEKWVLFDNRKRSGQWLDRDEAPKHMPKPNLRKKVLLTVWWGMQGIIHYKFLKAGETITSEKYCSELEVALEKLKEMVPSLVNRKGVIILQDNARPHVSSLTMHKLNQLNIEMLPHPPYSPDLSPTDFHFFKHVDYFIRNKTFADQRSVENSFQEFLQSTTPDFYKYGINQLISRWEKCVDANGCYFD